MITKAMALQLRHGQTLHHVRLKNRDGTPLRVRVSGKCQTWKTRPQEYRVPLKYGMYDNTELTQRNAAEWVLA